MLLLVEKMELPETSQARRDREELAQYFAFGE